MSLLDPASCLVLVPPLLLLQAKMSGPKMVGGAACVRVAAGHRMLLMVVHVVSGAFLIWRFVVVSTALSECSHCLHGNCEYR